MCFLFPQELEYALKVFNYFFTAIFIIEASMKVSALGITRYLSDRLDTHQIPLRQVRYSPDTSQTGKILTRYLSDR